MREVIGARGRQCRRDRDGGCYHRRRRRGQVLPGGAASETSARGPGAPRSFRGLSLVPQLIHLFECRSLRGLAPLRQRAFDRGKTALEFVICSTQRCFRIHIEMTGKIDHREQEVAHLGTRVGTLAGSELGLNLVRLFTDLGEHRERVVPIEADLAGFGLQFERTGEGRERDRNAGEGACGFLAA